MKMVSEDVLFSLAVVISAFVVLASGYLCYVSPERPWPYLLAIAVVCVAWTARHLNGGDGDANPASRAARRKLTQAIVSSGLLLGIALGVALIASLG